MFYNTATFILVKGKGKLRLINYHAAPLLSPNLGPDGVGGQRYTTAALPERIDPVSI
jgi:hypothetical protein